MTSVRSGLWPLRSTGKVASLLGVDWQRVVDLAAHAGGQYKPMDRQLLNKPKWRHVDAPEPDLLRVQRRLYRRILQTVELPPNMFGAAPGRALRGHVLAHRGQPCVVTLDLRDFFPRTRKEPVYRIFMEVFGCPQRVAAPLTQLVTLRGGLPQGAPTSAMLAHLAIIDFRDEVSAVCERLGVRSSFYMDDLALSGRRARDAVEPVIRAAMAHGHSVASPKKRVMGAEDEKVITGHVLARNGLRVPEQYLDHVIEQMEDIIARGAATERELASIRGKIAFVASVCQPQAEPLREALGRLPAASSPGRKPKTANWAPCKGGDRCRASKQRRAMLARQKQGRGYATHGQTSQSDGPVHA